MISAAFGALVKGLVQDLITPIIAAIIGKPDFSALQFMIHKSHFLYGSFINDLITFISVAAAVFFFVVQPVNALMARRRTEPDVDSETHPRPECLSDIPRPARKCAFCGSLVQPAAGAPPETAVAGPRERVAHCRNLRRRESQMPPRGVKKGTKRARQYEHIKESEKKQGRSTERAEEIAARTVNKQRASSGESKQGSRSAAKG